MATKTETLPYGVGQFTRRFWLAAGLLAAVVGVGAFAYSRQFARGLAVTGLRDWGVMRGAPWGMYVAFDVYFVGVSFAGITVAALIRLANIQKLRPISRLAELLTVTSLLLAGFTVLADLGQPLRGIVNLFRYARPQSPFFGTFTLVIAGYLFASLVYLYLDARADAAACARVPGPLQGLHRFLAAGYRDTPAERERHHRVSFWLAVAILPLLVTAHSTLGFIFGLQAGRPGWFSALQAPAFVALAGVSGVGLLIVAAAVARRGLRAEDRLGPDVFRWLGNALLILTLAYLYFTAVEILTGIYASHEREAAVTKQMLLGSYGFLFWPSVGTLAAAAAILAWRYLVPGRSLAPPVIAGVLVNLGAIGKRLLIVVPSLTTGSLMPYPTGSYRPTWVEYAIVVGLFALGALLFVVAAKLFPIMEVPEEVREATT